jgi:hypothetical protein
MASIQKYSNISMDSILANTMVSYIRKPFRWLSFPYIKALPTNQRDDNMY